MILDIHLLFPYLQPLEIWISWLLKVLFYNRELINPLIALSLELFRALLLNMINSPKIRFLIFNNLIPNQTKLPYLDLLTEKHSKLNISFNIILMISLLTLSVIEFGNQFKNGTLVMTFWTLIKMLNQSMVPYTYLHQLQTLEMW